ncbi:MAG: peptidoglycan-associated lipoprotein Pal [Deltaproteobacteria bacterium]|nr:peptidoglycan-associated lipoprotein Pal [Deltaproteobacteria bacterium]
MKSFKWSLAVVALCVVAVGCAKQTTKKETKSDKLQSVYFDFDASDIKSEAEAKLKSNADWLSKNSKVKAQVQGNCDERGTNEYNIALGDRRAKSASKYLTNLGIDKSRLSTISYGEEKPVCTGHDESCWWQNRRDDTVQQ